MQDRQAWAVYQLMQDKDQWELIHQFLRDYLYSRTTIHTDIGTLTGIKDTIEALIRKGESYGQE